MQAAWAEAGITPRDRDVVAVTESVVARSQGNYATIQQIAADCGYPSAQYFAHMFAAHFGTTPDAWRRR